MNDITAVVLAGGVGKRFWPMTEDKNLFPFFGKPLIQYNLEQLKRIGAKNIIVVTNPQNNEQIKNLGVETVVQTDPRGMAGALLSIKNISGPCLVVNADDIVSPSLYDQIATAIQTNMPFIVGKKVFEYFDGGYIVVDGNHANSILEKPGIGNEPSDMIRLVFDYFPDIHIFLQHIAGSDRDDVYEQALNNYVKKVPTEVVSYDGVWAPCKYPHHVLAIMHGLFPALSSHRGENVVIKNNVVIEGEVWIGDNVKINENSKITGPVYIGANTIVGNNTMIRESHIGQNCVVGFDTDIARSYIGNDCWFHSNYLGDSVLENNIGMGAGAKLANLRLDDEKILSNEKLGAIIASDVRIGINASIMPGIKIGKNTFIGSGIILDQDLPDNSFCVAKDGFVIKENKKSVSPVESRLAFKAKV